MTSALGKGATPVTGFRYYMTLLLGIGRGPVDQIAQIQCGGGIVWDGSTTASMLDIPQSPFIAGSTTTPADTSASDPYPPMTGSWPGGPVQETTFDVPIIAPDAFGGDDREGGIFGTFDCYMGDKTQTLGSRIRNLLAGLRLPAMRGVVTLLFDGEICANNPYPKQFKFRVRRALKGWDGDPWYPHKAVIALSDPAIAAFSQVVNTAVGSSWTATYQDGTRTTTTTSQFGVSTSTTYDPATGLTSETMVPAQYNDIYAMNPAHIIYECCTNRDWGRGLDRALIDNLSFTATANTLYAEGFGLCLKWSRSDDIDAFVQTVIDHIGGVLYTDKVSGLLCLRLIRNDYNVADLPVFDTNSGLLSVTVAEVGAQDAMPNEIIVNYHSPVTNADRQARAQNIASINALGAIFSETKQYPGLPTSTLAVLVAQRDLKALSAGMKRVTFTVDRRGYLMVPGDVVIVNAPEQGLPNAILRVAQIEDTALSDGKITVTAGQDVFGLPLVPFTAPQQSTFMQPDLNPRPITIQDVSEATYRDVLKFGGASFVQSVPTGSGFVVMTAAAPTPAAYAFVVLSQSGSGYSSTPLPPLVQKGISRFAKLSTLDHDISTTDTVFRVTGNINPSTVGTGIALTIENELETYFTQEFVRLDQITQDTAGNVTLLVGRGAVDTPARAHAKGSRVWAYDMTGSGDTTEYAFDELVGMKGLTITSRGTLDLSLATHEFYQSVFGRVSRPYPGADFRVNGYPRDQIPTTGPTLVFTWKHRDRILQADKLVDETMASIGPEPGVCYGVIVYGTGGTYTGFNAPGALVGGATTFSGDTLTFTPAMAASAGIADGPMRLIFQTQRFDGGDEIPASAYRMVIVDFIYTTVEGGTGGVTPVTLPTSGWGSNFGSNFGG